MEGCMCAQPAHSTVSAGPIRIDGDRITPISRQQIARKPHTAETKLEIRNNVKCRKLKTQKRASLQAVYFRDLEIRILNLFRISKFELWISKANSAIPVRPNRPFLFAFVPHNNIAHSQRSATNGSTRVARRAGR